MTLICSINLSKLYDCFQHRPYMILDLILGIFGLFVNSVQSFLNFSMERPWLKTAKEKSGLDN